jgi:predicted RNase H-like HicB family nuclease
LAERVNAGSVKALKRHNGQRHSKETTVQPDSREYEIRIWYSAEKGNECFIAQVVEWPGIMAHGDTREEAARQIQLALEGALEVAAERGLKPPGSPRLSDV